MEPFKGIQNQKGEGLLKLLLILAILIGGGYFALKYFGVIGGPDSNAAASAPSTLNGGKSIAGSPAAAAVQGSEATGEVLGSGR